MRKCYIAGKIGDLPEAEYKAKFEQPEYEYSFDLEEDIKTVFGEINDLINEQ